MTLSGVGYRSLGDAGLSLSHSCRHVWGLYIGSGCLDQAGSHHHAGEGAGARSEPAVWGCQLPHLCREGLGHPFPVRQTGGVDGLQTQLWESFFLVLLVLIEREPYF